MKTPNPDLIEEIVRRVTSAVHPLRVILFGSTARGEMSPESDIDLLIVSPRFDAERTWEDVSLLWRTAASVDSRLEPIAVGTQQFEKDDCSAIIEIARREGHVVGLVA